MPRGFNIGASYHEKLAAMSPDEAAKMEAARRAKMSAGVNKTRAIQRIVNTVLKAEVNPNSYQSDILNTFGYEINECGLPTVAVMILLNMAYRACNGDVKAAEFLFSYGGIPNMDQMIRRDELHIMNERLDMDKFLSQFKAAYTLKQGQIAELQKQKLELELSSMPKPVPASGSIIEAITQMSDAEYQTAIEPYLHRKTVADAMREAQEDFSG